MMLIVKLEVYFQDTCRYIEKVIRFFFFANAKFSQAYGQLTLTYLFIFI